MAGTVLVPVVEMMEGSACSSNHRMVSPSDLWRSSRVSWKIRAAQVAGCVSLFSIKLPRSGMKSGVEVTKMEFDAARGLEYLHEKDWRGFSWRRSFKMFGFSRRRMKIGRLKTPLSESAHGTRSPIRHPKRSGNSNGEGVTPPINHSDEPNFQCSSAAPDLNDCTLGNSENWMGLSIAGDKPTPRFNHAAAVIGNKMVVVGGESTDGMLEDVQVLNFDRFSWTTASSKLYLSPTNLPLKIPACKGHSLVSWGKKVLLIGGKTDPASDRVSVWAFDTETECWSLMEAKGDVPVARSGHTVVRANSVLILFGGENAKRKKLSDLHMFDLKSFTWLPLHCTGQGPSPRSNHVAALYGDKMLLIFGGASKSKTLNDIYSLDFETMIWSKIKIRGFHPSPRAGCCGVLRGTKWYIAGGGSRKKRMSHNLRRMYSNFSNLFLPQCNSE